MQTRPRPLRSIGPGRRRLRRLPSGVLWRGNGRGRVTWEESYERRGVTADERALAGATSRRAEKARGTARGGGAAHHRSCARGRPMAPGPAICARSTSDNHCFWFLPDPRRRRAGPVTNAPRLPEPVVLGARRRPGSRAGRAPQIVGDGDESDENRARPKRAAGRAGAAARRRERT